MAKRITYKESGVDIEAGDAVAKGIGRLARSTFGPRVVKNDMGFAGLFRLDYNEKLFKRNYRDPVLLACTDTAGSKLKLAITMKKLDTIAAKTPGSKFHATTTPSKRRAIQAQRHPSVRYCIHRMSFRHLTWRFRTP